MSETSWIKADWPAPAHIHTLVTTRGGGVSPAPYHSLNLGKHVGDSDALVQQNRALVGQQLPAEPFWLNQTHSTIVVEAGPATTTPPEADASVTTQPDTVCCVMTADCLPVLFTNESGTVVAAAHAGWRGLCNGVLEATLARMGVAPGTIMAWMGPAIGPDAFEVGAEVRTAFIAKQAGAASAFIDIDDGKYLADIYQLARLRLQAQGVTQIYGGDFCTVIDREHFFSYRRDGITGRMGSMIWIAG